MSTSSQPQPQQQNPEAEQPKSSTVADNLKSLNNQIRAKIVSDALKKGSIGAVTGKLAPVWFGLGLGLGMAYSDGSQLIRSAHDSVLESALAHYNSQNDYNNENKINPQ